ncbi:hypothetical protein [Streptomyces sp. NPDC048282]
MAAGDTAAPSLYQRAADGLGRDVSGNVQDARSQWQADILRLHQLYRYK